MKNTQHYKKLSLIMTFAALGLLSSCKDDTNREATEPAQTTTTPAQNGAQQQTAQVNPQHGLPGHRCDIPVGAPLNASIESDEIAPPNIPSATISPIRVEQTPKVNPPHGQPGHDCSVPVGAELKQQ